MDIEWRSVVGWEGIYEVSSYGDVRRIQAAQHTRVGRVLKPAINEDGYLYLCLRKLDTKVSRFVHRLVAEAFLGPRPPGLVINHKDLNTQNNHYTNLEYITNEENLLHSRKQKPVKRGPSRKSQGRVTPKIAEEIRNSIEPKKVLAARYNLCARYISMIKTGRAKAWNVPPSLPFDVHGQQLTFDFGSLAV